MTFGQVAAMERWELAHWIAMLRLEPPVADVLNVTSAVQCAAAANSAFGSRGGVQPKRFLLDFDQMADFPKPPSPAAARARWVAWVAHCGGMKHGHDRQSQQQAHTEHQ